MKPTISRRRHAWSLVALLMVSSALTATGASAKPPQKQAVATQPAAPVLEAKAIDVLKAASARLAAARSMTFTATVSYESPSRSGPALVYTTKSAVALQRPDKLRVVTSGDGPASEFYYDGKTITAFSPAENLVAVTEGPASIDAALAKAYDGAAIYFPFTDVIVADPYADVSNSLQLAYYIGQSHIVGGTTTDMLAYATEHVFVQIWIGADDRLPRMMRAVYRHDPLQLRHQLDMSDWQLDVSIAEDSFASPAAATATRIDFARPDPMLPVSLDPPRKDRPSKKN